MKKHLMTSILAIGVFMNIAQASDLPSSATELAPVLAKAATPATDFQDLIDKSADEGFKIFDGDIAQGLELYTLYLITVFPRQVYGRVIMNLSRAITCCPDTKSKTGISFEDGLKRGVDYVVLLNDNSKTLQILLSRNLEYALTHSIKTETTYSPAYEVTRKHPQSDISIQRKLSQS